MAAKKGLNSPSVIAGFDYKRLPGTTRWGSQAFWRKVSTGDARLSMAAIIKRYETLIRDFKNVTPTVLENAMRPVFKRAQYYVPENTGDLWASGKLTSGTNSYGQAYANITFGDDVAWYAALVHEFVWLKHEAPTRSKYLQAAMEEGVDRMLEDIAAGYASMLG